jgi:hypothetical protein
MYYAHHRVMSEKCERIMSMDSKMAPAAKSIYAVGSAISMRFAEVKFARRKRCHSNCESASAKILLIRTTALIGGNCLSPVRTDKSDQE